MLPESNKGEPAFYLNIGPHFWHSARGVCGHSGSFCVSHHSRPGRVTEGDPGPHFSQPQESMFHLPTDWSFGKSVP